MPPIVRMLALFAVFWALLATPLGVSAQIPGDDLAALATHVDAALARLSAGDTEGARSEFAAFNDGWPSIEDSIRYQSLEAYAAIEAAMGDAQFSLNATPANRDAATVALQRLRDVTRDFIAGKFPAGAPAAPSGKVTVASLVGRLNRALDDLDAGHSPEAAAEIAAFRREWLDVEVLIKGKSAAVYTSTENDMARAAAQLGAAEPDVAAARSTIQEMRAHLQPYAASDLHYGTYDALIIILREGLEALLVVAALIAFLKRSGNSDKTRWVWGGGGAGVLASIIVAVIINLAVSQAAGSNRELVEGFTGLIAAVMLVYVSVWLHSKSHLGAWQQYIDGQTSAALARNSLFSLAFIAFLAVFREGAETVLFYIGIAPSISTGSLISGIGIGIGLLAAIGVAMLLFGMRLPLRPFFLIAGVLVFYLAFKFLGTGIHSLQVAGKIAASQSNHLVANGFFGLYPTWETTVPQIVLAAAAIVYLVAPRMSRRWQSGVKA